MLRNLTAGLAVFLASSSAALATTISGMAEVVDSDIFRLEGYRVFLLGVESVEEGQTCLVRDQIWECYPPAKRALQTIVESGPVTCEVISGPDMLRQVIARCSIGGEDIGERFVREGLGLAIPAETEAYAEAEAAAQADGIGLWQGVFMPPADWRRLNGVLVDRPTFRPVGPVP